MRVSNQLHPPPQGSGPRQSLDRGLGGPQSRSEPGGEEKKTPAPAGNQTPVFQPGYQSLCWPKYSGSYSHYLRNKVFQCISLNIRHIKMFKMNAVIIETLCFCYVWFFSYTVSKEVDTIWFEFHVKYGLFMIDLNEKHTR
jgi:hypothetical protein